MDRKMSSSSVERAEATPCGATSMPLSAGGITLAQLERGVAAIDRYRSLVHTVYEAFRAADEDRIDGLGGSGLVNELTRQLEERCQDHCGGGGSMIEYMLYEGRDHGGRCVTADGREFNVDSPTALWSWRHATETGPFTPSREVQASSPSEASAGNPAPDAPLPPASNQSGEAR